MLAREEGFDFTVVRDWALEQGAQHIESLRLTAWRAERESVDDIGNLTLSLTQQMVQQVYQRPYASAVDRVVHEGNGLDLRAQPRVPDAA